MFLFCFYSEHNDVKVLVQLQEIFGLYLISIFLFVFLKISVTLLYTLTYTYLICGCFESVIAKFLRLFTVSDDFSHIKRFGTLPTELHILATVQDNFLVSKVINVI